MKIENTRYGILAGLMLLAGIAHTQTTAIEPRVVSGSVANRIEAPTVMTARAFGGALMGGEVLLVGNAPFSAVGTMTHVHKLLDGNRVTRKDTTTYYRDGQGRVRVERTMGRLGAGLPGPDFTFVSITDPVSGKTLTLQPQARTYYEYLSGVPAPALAVPVKATPPQVQTVLFGTFIFGSGSLDNVREIPLGDRMVDGIRVVGTRVEQTIPAGRVGNERAIVTTAETWFSEELGAVIECTQRSPTGIESTYRLRQIVRGEPASELFAAPAEYVRQEVRSGVSPMPLVPQNSSLGR